MIVFSFYYFRSVDTIKYYICKLDKERFEIIDSQMKKKSSIIFYFLIITFSIHPIFAQSPYEISWNKDGYIIGGGAATGLTATIIDHSIQPLTLQEVNQLSRESINWFDRSAAYNYSESTSTASDVLLGISIAAPIALLTDQAISKDWQTVMLMYMETYGFVESTTLLGKVSVQRLRPMIYNPNVPFDKKSSSDSRKSFFSAHTSAAFASAVFISTVFSDYNPDSNLKPYIWTSSLLTAAIVGFLRYEAGKHYPTDILVGAVVGSAIGYAIPWMHRADKESLTFVPSVSSANIGFSVKILF
jgi:membrane-associated phospholipid phosphatase